MFNTFNMGVGMVLTVAAEDADKALRDPARPTARMPTVLGEIVAEGEGVELV